MFFLKKQWISPAHATQLVKEACEVGDACCGKSRRKGKPYTLDAHAKDNAEKIAQRKGYYEIGQEGHYHQRAYNGYATQGIGVCALQAVAKLIEHKGHDRESYEMSY